MIEKWVWEPLKQQHEMTGRPNRQVMETLTEIFGEPPWVFEGASLEKLRCICLGARSVTGPTETKLIYEFLLDKIEEFGAIRVGLVTDMSHTQEYPEHSW